ncbi:MAG: FAD-dependent oxidoreductase [Lachnospiraceae bacterium]|nr:FAD-dependent oxidoreductase [Lachnospiraceae bacterium]
MESIWHKTAEFPEREAFAGSCFVDAAVIGGGLAGILTAYFLKQRGLKVIVLEADRIGGGQTGNTTAKITVSHHLIYDRLIQQKGFEAARQYAQINKQAIGQYARLIKRTGISCDFREAPSYLYSVREKESLWREAAAAEKLGLSAALTNRTELPFSVEEALCYEGQACFHPLKFLYGLAEILLEQGVIIAEKTPAEQVVGNRVKTPYGIIHAEHIVFASHYPFVNIPGYYFMRLHQERSYAAAFTGCPKLEGMYLGIDKTLPLDLPNSGGQALSFRSHGEYLILGGYGHRTGENLKGGQYRKLEELAKSYWPDCRQETCWSAQDGFAAGGVPFIGNYSFRKAKWYVAAGFQKWGMTSSMAAASIISSSIAGNEKQPPFADVFSPQNFSVISNMPKLIKEGIYAAKHLLKEKFTMPGKQLSNILPGQGGIIHYQGEKRGVYKDKNGTLYFVTTKCPHLGCELSWNPEEHSWDCPCHGSRFNHKGELLNNPAAKGIGIEIQNKKETM